MQPWRPVRSKSGALIPLRVLRDSLSSGKERRSHTVLQAANLACGVDSEFSEVCSSERDYFPGQPVGAASRKEMYPLLIVL
jgi:hypothetical protein